MSIKIGYAGDRQIAVDILSFIIEQDVYPSILMVSDRDSSSHSQDLISLCGGLPKSYILTGSQTSDPKYIAKIGKLNLDYLICIHFPFIIPESILNCVNIGVLNLHPAYLPYNRGWNTPTWAILEGTPYGATLHFMDDSLDTGDIVHQRTIDVYPNDTANSLYKRTLDLEIEAFKEAWPMIESKMISRKVQRNIIGTSHKKQDLRNVQKINLNQEIKAKCLIDQLRALTTNNIHEAAYFEQDGNIYRIQVKITKETPE